MSSSMVRIYADLVRKGVKTIEDVPGRVRDEVQQLLDQQKDKDSDD